MSPDLFPSTMAYFMAAKSEAPTTLVKCGAGMENQFNLKIKHIIADGRGEYSSAQFLKFPASEGIIKSTNGISERCNRSMMDPARAMSKGAGMPNFFWAEAVNTAVYIKSRLPSRASPDKTVYEHWFGTKPDIKHIRTFGCLAYAWNSATTKLDDKALRTISCRPIAGIGHLTWPPRS